MKFYRIEDRYYAGGCEDNPYTIERVEKLEYTVVSETKCGYWIQLYLGGQKRWVSKTSTKRFAYPTLEEAKKSFILRKNRQIHIYETKIRRIKSCLFKLELNQIT